MLKVLKKQNFFLKYKLYYKKMKEIMFKKH